MGVFNHTPCSRTDKIDERSKCSGIADHLLTHNPPRKFTIAGYSAKLLPLSFNGVWPVQNAKCNVPIKIWLLELLSLSVLTMFENQTDLVHSEEWIWIIHEILCRWSRKTPRIWRYFLDREAAEVSSAMSVKILLVFTFWTESLWLALGWYVFFCFCYTETCL